MLVRDDHLIRFGAFASSARREMRRARLALDDKRRRIHLTLARSDAESARYHWQQSKTTA